MTITAQGAGFASAVFNYDAALFPTGGKVSPYDGNAACAKPVRKIHYCGTSIRELVELQVGFE